jgi:Kef-type K+ transport system membrane component KefB
MEQFIRFTLFLVTLIVFARLASLLSRRFHIPAVTIQLLVGIFFGPSLLNLLGSPIVVGTWGSPSPGPLHGVLKILAEIGLIQLMFLASLQTDWQELKKMLRPIFSLSIWGFVLTTACVVIIARLFVDRWAEALGVSAIMVSMSFGISAYNFSEMKFLESRASKIVLGSGLLSSLLAILLMIASLTTNYAMAFGGFKSLIAVSWFLGKLIMFFAISNFLMSRFLKLTERTGFQKRPLQMLMGYLLLVASLYAWAAMHFGSFAGVGVASLGGMLLGMSDFGLKERITKGFGSPMISLPIGVLFVVLGMEVNFKEPGLEEIFLAILFGVVVGTKLIGSWMAAHRKFNLPYERGLIMIGTLPQGEMGMLMAAYLFSRGLVNPSSFNAVIIVVIVLTMLTPIVMKLLQNCHCEESPAVGRQSNPKRLA